MQVTLHSTNEFSFIDGTRCRVWRGKSKGGVECFALIPLIGVSREADQSEFERELVDQPHRPHGTHFDLRNVI